MTTPALQPEFDFEHELPAGKEWFSVRWLARHWGVSERTITRLIEEGSLRKQIDLAPGESKHALIRVARAALVKFLNKRSNLDALAAARAELRKHPLNARSQRMAPRPAENIKPTDPARSSLL